MSTSAWITMLTTWAIVVYFTLRFFIKVVRTPLKKKHTVKDA